MLSRFSDLPYNLTVCLLLRNLIAQAFLIDKCNLPREYIFPLGYMSTIEEVI